jgi:hypothetical protein
MHNFTENPLSVVLFCRPVAGSKTDIRGKKAYTHISKEVLQLCQIIYENGEPIEEMTEDGHNQIVITFGELFQVCIHTHSVMPDLIGYFIVSYHYGLGKAFQKKIHQKHSKG